MKILKNNIIAFSLNLVILVVAIVISIIFVSTGPALGKYTTSLIGRLFFILLFIGLYFITGLLLDTRNDKKYDLYSGIIIGLIGVGLWVYTFLITGKNLIETPEDLQEYWILYNVYYFANFYKEFTKVNNYFLIILIIVCTLYNIYPLEGFYYLFFSLF